MSQDQITTTNWGQAPYNRRSFQQVQQLFPTARIRRGGAAGAGFETPAGGLNLADISYPGLDGSTRRVTDMLADTYTDAFLVSKHGELLHEEYGNGMAPDSLHLLNSVTKSLTGMAAGVLIERGVFSAEDKVAVHLPELAKGAFKDTTVRHLLDMTAAVKFGEDYADTEADFWVETAVVGWRPALQPKAATTSLLDYAASLTATEQSDGEHYHYRTVLTNVLGMVMERASGRALQDLLEQDLWVKLRPEQDLLVVVDALGFPYVGAGGNACARDLLRFGQLLAQSGQLHGEQVIPKRFMDDTRLGTDIGRAQLAASDYAEMLPGGHYRNKMWVADAERGVMMAIGIHGQTIHINMTTGVVMVKLSSHPESADMALFGDTFAAMNLLSDLL